MASLQLKKDVERNSVVFATTDITKTIDLATPLTDVSKSVLLFSVSLDSSSPVNFMVLGRILSTTQIQFERASTPGVACTVSWEVAEYSQGIYVQHFYFQQATDTVNTTISSVDMTKTFALITQKNTGTNLGADDIFQANITSATNLATIGGSTGASCYLAVQVIQIDDATVQKISTTLGTSATKDVGISSITEDKTFWFFGLSGVGGSTYGMQDMPYLSYVNSSTLRYIRPNDGVANFGALAYVVSLSSGVTVQNIFTSIASSSNVVSASIPSSVVVANTVLNNNAVYQKFATSPTAGDEAGYSSFLLSGLTTNQFVARRAASPAVSASTNVQVMTFTTSAPTISSARIFNTCFESFFEPFMN